MRIAPELTALVIVDMQNLFLHPKIRRNAPGLKIIDNVRDAVAKCRELDIQARSPASHIGQALARESQTDRPSVPRSSG